ncbi:hypothetical protein AVEN_156119-1 [Araneus ventricosus]|uniref:Uncharacterized protein n=1 Tax=Araneus ventricosus TaxID=182803 RepID=A0A4Y2Q9E6_ARAVE|nr:hypothetical protein AVEN_156119-1 [Araneus ventricosus]
MKFLKARAPTLKPARGRCGLVRPLEVGVGAGMTNFSPDVMAISIVGPPVSWNSHMGLTQKGRPCSCLKDV